MKKRVTIISILILISFLSFSQTAQDLAQKQAKKMKDSVGVTESVMQQIYAVNMQIHTRKQEARIAYANSPVLMQEKIQFYERQRDSLYKVALASEEKYILYKQKKNNILRAN